MRNIFGTCVVFNTCKQLYNVYRYWFIAPGTNSKDIIQARTDEQSSWSHCTKLNIQIKGATYTTWSIWNEHVVPSNFWHQSPRELGIVDTSLGTADVLRLLYGRKNTGRDQEHKHKPDIEGEQLQWWNRRQEKMPMQQESNCMASEIIEDWCKLISWPSTRWVAMI